MTTFRPAVFLSLAALVVMPIAHRSSSTAVVGSFYAWYAKHSPFNDDAPTRQALQQFFTPSLYTNFVTVVHDDRCLHYANFDWDPFSDSQVAMGAYHVGSSKVTGSSATVPVTITLKWWNGRIFQGNTVTVSTIRTSSGWRIADVIDKQSGSLQADFRRMLPLFRPSRLEQSSSQRPTAAQLACLQQPIR
jgi:hypothetical protein